MKSDLNASQRTFWKKYMAKARIDVDYAAYTKVSRSWNDENPACPVNRLYFIMEGEGGLTTLTKAETDQLNIPAATANDASLIVQNITGKYHSQAIAQNVQMSLTEFTKLNPNFDKQLSANGHYDLRLPTDKMELFKTNKVQILQQSVGILLGMTKI